MSGETYVRRYPGGFVDLPSQTTAIDSQFLNAVEQALLHLLGEDPGDQEVGVWVAASGRLVFQKITNAHIDPAAQIPRSKLDFGAGLVNADMAPGMALAYSKLNLLGSIVSADIANGTIVDGDVSASAGLQASKLAGYPADASKALLGDGTWGAGILSGTGALWFLATAPSGWALLDGSTLVNAQTVYPALWANVDTAWKSGSNIILPDLRGRVPVGKGSNALVNAFNANEGVTEPNRRPKHQHTAHSHSVQTPSGGGVSGPAGSAQGTVAGNTGTKDGGSGVATDPVDTPAFIVVNFIIKL